MYDQGRGVTQNYKEAVWWYRKAAEQGDAVAQFNLAEMYRNGLGVAKDLKRRSIGVARQLGVDYPMPWPTWELCIIKVVRYRKIMSVRMSVSILLSTEASCELGKCEIPLPNK